jgi:hypothetical protein
MCMSWWTSLTFSIDSHLCDDWSIGMSCIGTAVRATPVGATTTDTIGFGNGQQGYTQQGFGLQVYNGCGYQSWELVSLLAPIIAWNVLAITPCVCSMSPHCPTQQCVHCTMDWSLWLKEWHVKGYWESTKWSSVYSRSPAERCLESVQQDAMSKCSLNWTTMILGHTKWEKRQQALQLFFPNASGRCATRLC